MSLNLKVKEVLNIWFFRLQDLLRVTKMTRPKEEVEKEELEIDEEKLFENGMKSETFLSPKSGKI